MLDAFEEGYRVGIVGNSDGHKGRPGASYPGSSLFGAIGGLTCFLSKNLSREGIIDSINKRHHYATSGGPTGRMYIDLKANFTSEGLVFHDDPKLFDTKGRNSKQAIMGDIVNLPNGEMSLNMAIVKLAQEFTGSNNINLLHPGGQFGTRLAGGKDSASERYIFTEMNSLTRYIYRDTDDKILDYLDDDGLSVEPVFYAPIIPMVIIPNASKKYLGKIFIKPVLAVNLLNDISAFLKEETYTD